MKNSIGDKFIVYIKRRIDGKDSHDMIHEFESFREYSNFLGEHKLKKGEWVVVGTTQELSLDENAIKEGYLHYKKLLSEDKFLGCISAMSIPVDEGYSQTLHVGNHQETRKLWNTTELGSAFRRFCIAQTWKGDTTYGKIITHVIEAKLVSVRKFKKTVVTTYEEI